MKISLLNKIKILKYSLLNEFSIDEFDMLNAYKKYSKNIVYPRTSKFVSYVGNNLFSYTLILIISIFSFVLWPIYFIYQFFFIRKKINIYKNIVNSNNKIAIITDNDLINKNNNILNESSFVISISNSDLDSFKNFKLTKNELISFFDVYTLIETIIINFYLIFIDQSFKFKMFPQLYVLHSFNVYINNLNKIIEDFGIDKEPSFIYTSHYDRWAVLFDFFGKNNVIVQHGILNESFFSFYKQNNVSKIYVLNEKSEKIFRKNHIKSNFDFEIIKYNLPLIKCFNDFTILFISRPADFEFEKEIFYKLLQLQLNVKFIFKPHPSYDVGLYHKFNHKNKNIIIFENKTNYPFANVIISGNSTLAFEYSNNGFIIIPIETPIDILQNKIISLYEEFKASV